MAPFKRNSRLRIWLSILGFTFTFILSSQIATAKERKKGAGEEIKVSLTALNYHQGETVITPGRTFTVEINARLEKEFKLSGRNEVPVAFFLIPQDINDPLTKDLIERQGILLGHAPLIFSGPLPSTSTRIPVRDELKELSGAYNLVAWAVPKNSKTSSSGRIAGPLAVTLSNEKYGLPDIEIVEVNSSRKSSVIESEGDILLDGTVSLESYFNSEPAPANLEFCLVLGPDRCVGLEVWNSEAKNYSDSSMKLNVEKGEVLTTLFQVRLPDKERVELSPSILGEAARLRVSVKRDQDPGSIANTAEVSMTLYPPLSTDLASDTDFSRDLKLRQATARRILKRERRQGLLPRLDIKVVGKGGKGKIIEIDSALNSIVERAREIVKLAATVQPDSYSLPPNLQSSIPGSRFNMPDQDFPWLNNIGVKADPPPEQYRGVGYPSYNEFKRCIPFFCGPNSPSEAGREPSQSCIRQYCGSTLEDINYGGRNTNLIDQQAGFDKNFSAGGFGARVGIGMQAKVYHDKAISDYVAASFESNAYFGVKVFDYSVPLFEAGTQAVYSPTEIGNSLSRTEIKILGKVVERESKQSSGLSKTFSKTYGVDKKANVGLGPISVKVTVEAGGTGSITAAIEQIDVLRGIVGSLTPSASIGASARASVDIGIGDFGIEGSLTLVEDRVPLTATFNAGLDLARKLVRPQLNLNIKNILDGPNGRIRLVLEVGVDPFSVTYSVTLVSFSTGSFENTIYNKDTVFAEIRY